jgi:hypothetical protein
MGNAGGCHVRRYSFQELGSEVKAVLLLHPAMAGMLGDHGRLRDAPKSQVPHITHRREHSL